MLATVISNDRVSRPKADLHYRGSSGHPVNWIHAYMSALLRILFGTNLLGFYDTLRGVLWPVRKPSLMQIARKVLEEVRLEPVLQTRRKTFCKRGPQ